MDRHVGSPVLVVVVPFGRLCASCSLHTGAFFSKHSIVLERVVSNIE